MKPNEFTNKHVDEAFQWGKLNPLTDYGKAAFQSLTSKSSTRDILEKNIFMRDFIGKLTDSIENGIEGGLINPSIKGGATPTTPPTSPTATEPGKEPASATEPKTDGTAQGTPGQTPAQGQPAAGQSATAKSPTANLPKMQYAPGFNKPMPAGTTQPGSYAAPSTSQQVVRKAPVATGPVTSTPQQVTTKLPVRSTGPSLTAPGQFTKFRQPTATTPKEEKEAVKESKFRLLNNLFEEIMTEQAGRSISQHVKWFMKSMGFRMTEPDVIQQLDVLAREIETAYPNVDKAIEKLGKFAWAITEPEGKSQWGGGSPFSMRSFGGEPERMPKTPSVEPETPSTAEPGPVSDKIPVSKLSFKDLQGLIKNMSPKQRKNMAVYLNKVLQAKTGQSQSAVTPQ